MLVVMILYRGYSKKPLFLTPKLQKELSELDILAEGCLAETGNVNFAKFLEKHGEQKMNRFFELSKTAEGQLFSDQRQVAEQYAGKQGFVATIDMETEEAKKYYKEERVVSGGHLSSNFEIPAEELYKLQEGEKCTVEAIHGGLKEQVEGGIARIKNRFKGSSESFGEKRI